MINAWKEHLVSNGAELENGLIEHFGNPQQERKVVSSGDIMCDLSHLSVLEVSGEESAEFLQNQFTNDIQALQSGSCQLNGWCTPKGRMVALFQTIRMSEERFLLLCPAELSEGLIKRLQMFVFRSKVSIRDRSDSTIRIGLSGRDAEQQLSTLSSPPPAEIDSASFDDNITVIRAHPALFPRFLILIDLIEAARKLWSHLDVRATAVGHHCWELLNIRAGIPSVVESTQESFIPQMLNLQAINGLSFTKGCYPGQEIVARMEYLGKLKRGLFHITLSGEHDLSAGDTLYSESSKSGQGAGEIVAVERNGDNGWEGLAVIEVSAAESDNLTLDQSATISVTIQAPKG
ncbi:MAG: folate-binding protein YgfZ [Gammaproteobacteria bacterium]|nr:folate-binding protein YgfZ [Gammaproteobacteria bacterium]MBT3488937.1 folate-binding protein YgfZ [Gammaproteobacteria bacterium]MBT3719382.1 folate-binding protein YgfZ [Gammaproteobacteria bacterium]MBT3844571.1 folate-binding protein YgfZ [Gammaproteobacteria bacterium]MBT3893760.1 folate-binding protein YgfZ [Gammaproteobacteria bacterium]